MKPAFPLMLTLALFTSAVADAQTGTRIPDPAAVPREVGKSDQASEAQRVMNDYGACIIRTSRRASEAVLAEFPGTKQADKALAKLASPNCLMYGELRFSEGLFRGSLFEALYAADFTSAPADLSAAPAIDYFVGATDRTSDAIIRQVAFRQFADCIVRANPVAARSLVLSKVGDSREKAAFAELMPAASECLTAGSKLTFSRPSLRGLIAETIYRLSKAVTAPMALSR